MSTQSEAWRSLAAQLARTTRAKGRAQTGTFSIEGVRLLERALNAGANVTHVLHGRSFLQDPSPRAQRLRQQLAAHACTLVAAPDDVLAELTNGRSLGPLLGLVQLPTPPSLARLLQETAAPLLLVAVDVIDPGNLGALMRTAHGLGAAALVPIAGSDPYHPKAVRTSMGSIFKLPVIPRDNAETVIDELHQAGITCAGAVSEGGVLLPEASFAGQGTAVFLGSEYWGLPPELVARLDVAVSIPMTPGIDSFSINAAAAILLYEHRRRQSSNHGR